ncbi:MAG: PIN domain-containing protein [Acidimicrobiales bacterium]
MIVADTSGLLTFFNRREPRHSDVRRVVEGGDDVLVISPYVIAELDYLVATRLGVDAEAQVLTELSAGAYHLAPFGPDDLRSAVSVIERYEDQQIGLADASLVVLASRHRTRSVLTLDHRHFAVLRGLDDRPFQLLP